MAETTRTDRPRAFAGAAVIRGLVYMTGLATLALIAIVGAVAYRVHEWPWGDYIREGSEVLSEKLDPRGDADRERARERLVARRREPGPAGPDLQRSRPSGPAGPDLQRSGPSGPPSARHEVRRGETLYGIARRYYGDPLCWQQIARANDIRRPSDLRVGRLIVIPHEAPGRFERAPYHDLRLALTPAFDPRPPEERDP